MVQGYFFYEMINFIQEENKNSNILMKKLRDAQDVFTLTILQFKVTFRLSKETTLHFINFFKSLHRTRTKFNKNWQPVNSNF